MKTKIFKKSVVISTVLIVIVVVVAVLAYGIISTQQSSQRVEQMLREQISQKGIMMEDALQPEIALTKKLATSPVALEYFQNPEDPELRKRAWAEFASFREAFNSHIVFWANDIDKDFYNGMEYSYTINPENPADYWYKMTLYETDVYNFNINYNAELDQTCLWLNAVMRDSKKKPIGMSGTGIELDAFIDSCYDNLNPGIQMYFFNEGREITGVKGDKQVVVDKKLIDSIYEGQNIDFDYLMKKAKEAAKEDALFEFEVNPLVSGVIRYLPSYGWYVFATASVSAGRQQGVSFLMIVIIAIVVIFAVFVIIIAKLNDVMVRIRASREKELAVAQKERKIGERLFEEAQNLVVATKETAATSQDSSAAVKEIVATMEDSNVLSENISTKIKDVSSIANQTSTDVTEGVAQIEQNVAQLHEIFDANQQTIDGIKILSEKIESIWDIVTLINNVADQALSPSTPSLKPLLPVKRENPSVSLLTKSAVFRMVLLMVPAKSRKRLMRFSIHLTPLFLLLKVVQKRLMQVMKMLVASKQSSQISEVLQKLQQPVQTELQRLSASRQAQVNRFLLPSKRFLQV